MIVRFTHQVCLSLAVLSAATVGLIALGTSANVISRAVTDRPIPGVIDIGSLLIVAAVFAAAAQAERSEAHVRMRLVTDRIPTRVAHVVRTVAMTASALFVGFMTYATALRAQHSFLVWETQVSALRWPVWPARMVITLGLAFLCLILVIKAVSSFRSALNPAKT